MKKILFTILLSFTVCSTLLQFGLKVVIWNICTNLLITPPEEKIHKVFTEVLTEFPGGHTSNDYRIMQKI
jgi:hypothetical protein